MRCKECGEKINPADRYCDFCGSPIYQKRSIYDSEYADFGEKEIDKKSIMQSEKLHEIADEKEKPILIISEEHKTKTVKKVNVQVIAFIVCVVGIFIGSAKGGFIIPIAIWGLILGSILGMAKKKRR